MKIKFDFAAIMSYKALPFAKNVKKVIHLVLHGLALLFGIFGIYAAFKFHNESGFPNLYSFHSWVGLGTICFYGLQVCYLLATIKIVVFCSVCVINPDK